MLVPKIISKKNFPILLAFLLTGVIIFIPKYPAINDSLETFIPDETTVNLAEDIAIPFLTSDIPDFNCLKDCKLLKYRNFNISVTNSRFNNQDSLQFIVRKDETIFLYFNNLDINYVLSVPYLGLQEILDPQKTNILAIPILASGEFEIGLESLNINNHRAGIIKTYGYE